MKLFARHKTRFSAVSLVEVLVVLALVATTMVAATQITVTALVKIKENEVDDYVNGLMVRVLEAVKSPQTLNINNDLTGISKFEGGYILDLGTGAANPNDPQGTNPTFRQQTIDLQKIPSDTCTSSSPNFVQIPNLGNFTPPAVCLQALVRQVTGISATPIYEVTVRAVYNLSTGPVERELIGYRRVETATVALPSSNPAACVNQIVQKTFATSSVDAQGFTVFNDSLTLASLNANYPKWKITISADGATTAPATVSISTISFTNPGPPSFPGDDAYLSMDYNGNWEKGTAYPSAYAAIGNGTLAPLPATITLSARAKQSLPVKYSVAFCGPLPAACGNSKIEANETCDDGNTAAGDGCSQTCTLECVAKTVNIAATLSSTAGSCSFPSGPKDSEVRGIRETKTTVTIPDSICTVEAIKINSKTNDFHYDDAFAISINKAILVASDSPLYDFFPTIGGLVTWNSFATIDGKYLKVSAQPPRCIGGSLCSMPDSDKGGSAFTFNLSVASSNSLTQLLNSDTDRVFDITLHAVGDDDTGATGDCEVSPIDVTIQTKTIPNGCSCN